MKGEKHTVICVCVWFFFSYPMIQEMKPVQRFTSIQVCNFWRFGAKVRKSRGNKPTLSLLTWRDWSLILDCCWHWLSYQAIRSVKASRNKILFSSRVNGLLSQIQHHQHCQMMRTETKSWPRRRRVFAEAAKLETRIEDSRCDGRCLICNF